jgi:glycosyltransferase involved in cell wall biosynthesis
MPQTTVVMATFNNSATIEGSVQSVIDQTTADWELIIVDDASTDETAGKTAALAESDERIRVIRLPQNSGSAVARNAALAAATGRFIAVLDADDLCMPARLEKQAKLLEADDDLVAVASQLAEFGDWGGPETAKWPVDSTAIEERQKSYRMPLPHPSTMFRADSIKKVGGYDETCRRAQDYALFLKLGTAKMTCIPEVLVHYRTERPISLGYVRRNAKYAALALRRHRLLEEGAALEDLPTEVSRSVKGEVGAIKSWVVRSGRERGILR